jgi:hypothetical protein
VLYIVDYLVGFDTFWIVKSGKVRKNHCNKIFYSVFEVKNNSQQWHSTEILDAQLWMLKESKQSGDWETNCCKLIFLFSTERRLSPSCITGEFYPQCFHRAIVVHFVLNFKIKRYKSENLEYWKTHYMKMGPMHFKVRRKWFNKAVKSKFFREYEPRRVMWQKRLYLMMEKRNAV